MEKLLQSKVQLLLSIIALLSVIFNVWIAAKLSPFAIDISKIDGRVSAIEKAELVRPGLDERFIQLEEKFKTVIEKTTTIDKKVDNLIELHLQFKK